jgi:predicted dinucleotide-binding enzyme
LRAERHRGAGLVEARKTVGGLMDAAGFAVVDLGTLASGARLMQFPGGPLPGLDLVRPG